MLDHLMIWWKATYLSCSPSTFNCLSIGGLCVFFGGVFVHDVVRVLVVDDGNDRVKKWNEWLYC